MLWSDQFLGNNRSCDDLAHRTGPKPLISNKLCFCAVMCHLSAMVWFSPPKEPFIYIFIDFWLPFYLGRFGLYYESCSEREMGMIIRGRAGIKSSKGPQVGLELGPLQSGLNLENLYLYSATRALQWLTGEHSAAFSCLRSTYFTKEAMEIKTTTKKKMTDDYQVSLINAALFVLDWVNIMSVMEQKQIWQVSILNTCSSSAELWTRLHVLRSFALVYVWLTWCTFTWLSIQLHHWRICHTTNLFTPGLISHAENPDSNKI